MIVIIMAGGLGKRMESEIPKVLHQVICPNDITKSYPMIIHIINTSIRINVKKIFVIVGKYRDIIKKTIEEYFGLNNLMEYTGLNNLMEYIGLNDLIEYIDQEPALGTGHAIKCSLPLLLNYSNEKALILSGDVPLISLSTLKGLEGEINKLLITELDEPFGCGRILFNEFNSNKIIGIKEEKDCNQEEKKIKLVNCGIYQIKVIDLINLIPLINNNNKSNEYYLTDIIGLMIEHSIHIETFVLEKNLQYEIKNVNTKKDLEELNNFIKNNANH
jgi:bifunctional N-acetylglucosamine-1-phosphate-uridyltransferase/glucosamine-1-phosphate-acetyltransferase GlmU-like protein